MPATLGAFGDRYGPYAFGVVSLLLIWFVIVKPELENSRLDVGKQEAIVLKQQEIVTQLTNVSASLEATSKTLEATAEINDRVAERLDRISDRTP